ncbi:MAG TPA: TIR domain-containing protein [Terriglobia bacterium]|nr:TIR domain-containing protein [Terriglobia bacterium]
MDKPRIFLGSSGKQDKLVQALTRGLVDVAHVEPWTTSFNPGTTTLERLLELAHEVDFAAFVFAQDDWTTDSPLASPLSESSQASPRDNVVFEAGLFGGALGMRRTFILHASGAKLPSDLLGLTLVRYEATTPAAMRVVNQKLRKAIENEGRVARIEGLWWQFSLTERTAREPSAVSLLRISRDRDGALELAGRSWQEDGSLSARYWSEAAKERKEPSRVFYYWKGERAAGPERAAVGRDGGDPDGIARARLRVLHDSCGHAPESERADGRCLLACRSRGHEHHGGTRRSEARGADRRAPEALEVKQDCLRSAHVISVSQALAVHSRGITNYTRRCSRPVKSAAAGSCYRRALMGAQ